MAKTWKCAHCSTENPSTTLTCTNCHRIQGSVVVPGSSWSAPGPSGPAPRLPIGPKTSGPVPSWTGTAPASRSRQVKVRTILTAIGIGIFLVARIGLGLIDLGRSTPSATPALTGLVNSPRSYETPVTKLEIGDCFDFKEPRGDPVRTVIAGPCTEPHQNELFEISVLGLGSYAGALSLDSTADARCRTAFTAYVGVRSYADTEIQYRWITPDETAWNAGDHSIRCFALNQRVGLLNGSVKSTKGGVVKPTPTMDPLLGRVAKIQTLTYGDCWDGEGGQPDRDGNVIIRPCFQDHQYEVFWTGPLSSFPPSDVTSAFWRDFQCPAQFKDYVGRDIQESELAIWLFVPTADQWRDGARFVSCSLHDPADPTLNTALFDSNR